MKETILKISNPTPKVQIQPNEDQLQPEISQSSEINLAEESQSSEPELEQTDIEKPTSMQFAKTSYSGWKASDILREIRLDSFEIDDLDLD
jgi:hypothetical protein